jgi:tetratricopeptide (TPR) repeat protein
MFTIIQSCRPRLSIKFSVEIKTVPLASCRLLRVASRARLCATTEGKMPFGTAGRMPAVLNKRGVIQMDLNGFNNFQDSTNPDRAYLECEEMFAKADDLIKEGDIKGAVELLFKITQRNPQFGKAYNHLGWVYENKYKNYAKAEEFYKKALQYSPEYAAGYLNYTYFLSNLSRFGELKPHLDKALTVPSVAKETIYNEYAIMLEMQQQPQEAMDYYVKAAMTTLDGAKLEQYKSSVERCKQKIELKNSLSGFYPTKNNY